MVQVPLCVTPAIGWQLEVSQVLYVRNGYEKITYNTIFTVQ